SGLAGFGPRLSCAAAAAAVPVRTARANTHRASTVVFLPGVGLLLILGLVLALLLVLLTFRLFLVLPGLDLRGGGRVAAAGGRVQRVALRPRPLHRLLADREQGRPGVRVAGRADHLVDRHPGHAVRA